MRGLLLCLLACAEEKGGGAAPEGEDTADEEVAWAWDDTKSWRENCAPDMGSAGEVPDYASMGVVYNTRCAGTNHQDIVDIGKVIFLGDSVTAGTPPTPEEGYYRTLLTGTLEARFGGLEVADCSRWGARTDDLLLPSDQQLLTCVPEVQPKPTLIVMTMGGNDMFAAVEDLQAGMSEAEMMAEVDAAAELMREALVWVRDQEATLFPAGVHVIFGNVYEFTDGTGDMASCPTAEILGWSAEPAMRPAYVSMNEQMVAAAVETQTDAVFMLENFCGHGFYTDDPNNECYRGPEAAELWFDPTCIHPNEAGHAALAGLFMDIVEE
jgi:lysophospholipase L1-like esterase